MLSLSASVLFMSIKQRATHLQMFQQLLLLLQTGCALTAHRGCLAHMSMSYRQGKQAAWAHLHQHPDLTSKHCGTRTGTTQAHNKVQATRTTCTGPITGYLSVRIVHWLLRAVCGRHAAMHNQSGHSTAASMCTREHIVRIICMSNHCSFLPIAA